MRILERVVLCVALAGCGWLYYEGTERDKRLDELTLRDGEIRHGAIAAATLAKERLDTLEPRVAAGLERSEFSDDVRTRLASVPQELDALTKLVQADSTAEAPRVLKAQELVIENAEGETVLRLGARPSGGGAVDVYQKNGKRVAALVARDDNDGELRLYDENGKLRANIGGNDVGGYANIYNGKGKMAAYIGSDSKDEAGYMAVYGADEKKLVEIYANDKGGTLVTRNLESGRLVATLGASNDTGTGLCAIATDAGKPGLALFVTENGGQIKALNADGKGVAFLGVSADPAGNGLVYVARKDGKRIFETGANASAGGYLSISNGKSERVIYMGTSTGSAKNDGVVEVSRVGDKLGVVLRAYSGGSSVRVYDANEKVKTQLR